MTKNGYAGFNSGLLFDLTAEPVSNTAQLYVAKFIDVPPLRYGLMVLIRSSALGDNDDGKLPSAIDPFADQSANFIEAELPFRNKDAIRAAGHAGMRGDPARMPAHHFHHHHAFVGFRRRVQAVDSFRDDLHGGIEAERVVGPCKVVVDCLRHANDRITFLLTEPVRYAERIFASHDDQIIQPILLPIGLKLLHMFDMFERIRSGRSQNSATSRKDAHDREFRQRYDVTMN